MNKQLFFGFFSQVFADAKKSDQSINIESVDVALECLSKVYGFNPAELQQMDNLPVSLNNIFEEGCRALCPEILETSTSRTKETFEDSEHFKKFLKTVTDKGVFGSHDPSSPEYQQHYEKVVQKYKQRFAGFTEREKVDGERNEDLVKEKEADEKKLQGNELLRKGDFQGAYDAYTEAIELCATGSNSHLYYCNRAAVLLRMGKNTEAASDCSTSIAIKSDYVKAHSRLAQAYLNLGNKKEAIESANRALELDASNKVAKEVLDAAGVSNESQGAPAGGMPTFPGGGSPFAGQAGGMGQMMQEMMKNPGFMNQMSELKQNMEGNGGMPDLTSMMSNPAMMQMAQNMMQNPTMMQMAQNMASDPNIMNMLGSMGGGMGDIGDMMQNMGLNPNENKEEEDKPQ